MADGEVDSRSASEKFLLGLLIERRSQGDALPDASAASELSETAMRFLDQAVGLDVLPEAWDAILNGDMHPLSAPKFRARDVNMRRRSWSDMVNRSASKIATAKAAFEAASSQFKNASDKLAMAQVELQETEMQMSQLRLQILLRELARYANAVFAVGPAWTVLKSLFVVPKGASGTINREDEANTQRMREKLLAYVEEEQFLEYLRVSIASAIVEFESEYPDKISSGAQLDDEDLRDRFSKEEKAVFAACSKAIAKGKT